MKIKKNGQCCTPVSDKSQPITGSGKDMYSVSLKHIRQAIDALGEISKDNKVAKDAIANLSVVYMELSENK